MSVANITSDQEYKYKLKKTLEHKTNFLVTDRKIIIWFNIFNRVLFKEKLTRFDQLHIFHTYRPYYGLCKIDSNKNISILKMRSKFKSKGLFLEILIHEMVHLHDYKKYGTIYHGKNFFRWKKKVNALGLNLKRSYQE